MNFLELLIEQRDQSRDLAEIQRLNEQIAKVLLRWENYDEEEIYRETHGYYD
jgi:hypothetical protein